MTAPVIRRLTHSTMPWVSLAERGVKLSASQVGQVEQPRPDPVSRTAAPVTMMNTSAASVARAMRR
jgi:hypothetical protein